MDEGVELTPEEGLQLIRNYLWMGEQAYELVVGPGEQPGDHSNPGKGDSSDVKAAPETIEAAPERPVEIPGTTGLDLSFLGEKLDLSSLPEIEVHSGEDRDYDFMKFHNFPHNPDALEVRAEGPTASVEHAEEEPHAVIPAESGTSQETPSPTDTASPPELAGSPQAPAMPDPHPALVEVPDGDEETDTAVSDAMEQDAVTGGMGETSCACHASSGTDIPTEPWNMTVTITPELAVRLGEEAMKIIMENMD